MAVSKLLTLTAACQYNSCSQILTTVAPTTPPNHPSNLLDSNTTPLQNGRPVYVDLATTKTSINQFIESLRPKIREFLVDPRVPKWVPPESFDDETRKFYSGLEIPLVGSEPSLLLHDLGNISDPNVDDLFKAGNPIYR